ncbi:MAG: alkaline phosphatase family protein [Chloroflexota bacterium]|nr:alkaline phosphatase family protein [Chloroflexota bacterium]
MSEFQSEIVMRFSFPDGELEAWATLGDVTSSSVKVWLRQPAGTVETARLFVGDEVVAEARLEPDPAHDMVTAGELRAAQPGASEPFRVEVAGMVRTGRFAPAENEPASFSFGFGSCHQPFEEGALGDQLRCHAGAGVYEPMLEELRRADARFVLLTGDQVYSDGVSSASVREKLKDSDVTDAELVEIYRHLYRGYFNQSGFRRLNEAMPSYLTWDDHDIFDGWGSQLNPERWDRRLFAAAESAYREYQHLRNPGASLTDVSPYAYGFWYAGVGFFVMDLRGCRDYQAGRVVGDEQWARLDRFLAEADQRGTSTVMLVASVPVVHLSPALVKATAWIPGNKGTDVRDRWNVPAFRGDREALLERCFTWRASAPARQVVILSGDVHVGAAFRVRPRRSTGWPRGTIVQWTSSALSTPAGFQHRVANRIGTTLVNLGEPSIVAARDGMNGRNNFGIVDVEPLAAGGHRLTFRLHTYEPGRDRVKLGMIVRWPLDAAPE